MMRAKVVTVTSLLTYLLLLTRCRKWQAAERQPGAGGWQRWDLAAETEGARLGRELLLTGNLPSARWHSSRSLRYWRRNPSRLAVVTTTQPALRWEYHTGLIDNRST